MRTRSGDTRQVEQTLDARYRRLCRHYWDIDPAATAFYVDAYRTTWDTDEERQ
jgi:hypothetical protein